MRILIVDDHKHEYGRFVGTLKKENPSIEIQYAISAVEAFEEFKRIECDLIILDQEMGGGEKNGTAFLRKLREWPASKIPEIIFVTGHYKEIPTSEILTIDVPITLFLEKDRSFQYMLLIATQLVMRRIDRTVRYDPEDLFGEIFIELIFQEANEVVRKEHAGYYSISQQRQIGTLVRSYINSLKMRSEWDVDDVLELSIFFAESLCKVFSLPNDLIEILRRFLNIEEILYTIPHYRDHFFHQIKVFFLGFCIINILNRHDCLKGTIFDDSDGIKIWFMASVFHDIGYPFEKMSRWLNSFVEGVLRSPGDAEPDKVIVPIEFHWGALLGRRFHAYHLERIVRRVCQLYGKETPEVVSEMLSGISSFVVKNPDHGLYSSLIVQNFLRYRTADNEVDPVSVAIALHNEEVAKFVKRLIGSLTFERDPLSFMLAYCDLAQDWGRIRPLGISKSGYGSFGYPVFASQKLFDPTDNMISVILRYERQLNLAERREWQENIYEKHIEPIRNYWAASSTGHSKLKFCIEYQAVSDNDPVLSRLVF